MKKTLLTFMSICILTCCVCRAEAEHNERRIDIGPAMSHFPVGFALVTHGNMQFVGYYDERHDMVVASRMLDRDNWQYHKLPSRIGWDSHNSITMAVDSLGYIHLSGNMHGIPLIYFRTTRPLDITTFEQLDRMTGENEDKVTYPLFMNGPGGGLIFHYRDGGSGHGNEIYNIYDARTSTWSRLLDTPLMDGQGLMNAYMAGPSAGPDGYYHMVWVWRDTYHCETNHHLSYARSKDMRNWESIAGEKVALPITIEKENLWVDPIPSGGGIINGAATVGFDNRNKALVTYYKYDGNGNSQAYISRFENGGWKISRLSEWNYRWNFSGGGAIHFEINVHKAEPQGNGIVKVGYSHDKYGTGYWLVDENTLSVVRHVNEAAPAPVSIPAGNDGPVVPAKSRRTAQDNGALLPDDRTYYLEWESLPPNRDLKNEQVEETPSMLRLVEVGK